ncbi:hypothetical protein M8J77_017304 [Diaphorina citri]|nr:hypothetical protein M8J77_017304 [Diaphorina citri]
MGILDTVITFLSVYALASFQFREILADDDDKVIASEEDKACAHRLANNKFYSARVKNRFSVVVQRLDIQETDFLYPLLYDGWDPTPVLYQTWFCNGKAWGVWSFGCGQFNNLGNLGFINRFAILMISKSKAVSTHSRRPSIDDVNLCCRGSVVGFSRYRLTAVWTWTYIAKEKYL